MLDESTVFVAELDVLLTRSQQQAEDKDSDEETTASQSIGSLFNVGVAGETAKESKASGKKGGKVRFCCCASFGLICFVA